jgi:hypothetical protein
VQINQIVINNFKEAATTAKTTTPESNEEPIQE